MRTPSSTSSRLNLPATADVVKGMSRSLTGDGELDPPTPRRRARDEEFSTFARGAQATLMRTAWLLTGSAHAAEDAVQEALTRTYVAWRRVRPDDAVAYARRALINLTVDDARRRRRQGRVGTDDDLGELPDGRTRPGTDVVDDRDRIVRLLQELTPRERAVVVLRYYADLSEHQVADALGVSTGTVKSTASRALQRVRAHVALRATTSTAPGADPAVAALPAAVGSLDILGSPR